MNRPPLGFVSKTLSEALEAVNIRVWRNVAAENVSAITCDSMRLCETAYVSLAIPPIWQKKKRAQLNTAIARSLHLLLEGYTFLRVVLVRGAGEFDELSGEAMRCYFEDVQEALRGLNRLLRATGVELVVVAENVAVRTDGGCSPDVHLLFAVPCELRGDAEWIRQLITAVIQKKSLGGVRIAAPRMRGGKLLKSANAVEQHLRYLFDYPVKLCAEAKCQKIMFCDGLRGFHGTGNPGGVSPFAVLNALMAFASPASFESRFKGDPKDRAKFRFVMRQTVRTSGSLTGRTNYNGPDCCTRACATPQAPAARDPSAPVLLRCEEVAHHLYPEVTVTIAYVKNAPSNRAALEQLFPNLAARFRAERAFLRWRRELDELSFDS